jgi:sulfofructose kinase
MVASHSDVLGLGNTAVDDILFVPHYPPADSKVAVIKSARQCGGLAATALVAASRLGAKCAYAGMLGHDELSIYVEENLLREGIDLTYVVRRPDAAPSHSTIVVVKETGTRNIFCETASLSGADDNLPSEEFIRNTKVLMIDRWGTQGMLRAASIARKAGIPVVSDIESSNFEGFGELFAAVDHVIISVDFALEYTGESTPEAAAKALWNPDRHTIVVTCGANGSVAISKEYSDLNPRRHQAFAVEVVDTTGCGDVFHGAYAAALAEGLDLDRRLEMAAATSALKATVPGGQAGIPSRKTVDDFLQARLNPQA